MAGGFAWVASGIQERCREGLQAVAAKLAVGSDGVVGACYLFFFFSLFSARFSFKVFVGFFLSLFF
jgi:hypothetical protein